MGRLFEQARVPFRATQTEALDARLAGEASATALLVEIVMTLGRAAVDLWIRGGADSLVAAVEAIWSRFDTAVVLLDAS